MKSWKRSIISLAVAFALLASFIPAPANVASAVVGTEYEYIFAGSAYGLKEGDMFSNNPAKGVDGVATTLIAGSDTEDTGDDVYAFTTESYSNYTGTGKWSVVTGESSSYLMDNAKKLRVQDPYLYAQFSALEQYATIRIEVEEAGWYSPSIVAFHNNTIKSDTKTIRGAYFRSYIAPVPSSVHPLTTNELDSTRLDEYSIGLTSSTDSSDNPQNGYVAHAAQKLRPVYIENEGEYIFAIKPEFKGPGNQCQVMIERLTLTKIADVNADKATVKAAIGNLNFSLADVLGENKSFKADEETVINVAASASSLGDDVNNILRSADKVTFESDAVAATYSDGKIKITGDVASQNAYLKIKIERDGITWEDTVEGITVTGESKLENTIDYLFSSASEKDLLNNDVQGKNSQNNKITWSSNKEYSSGIREVSRQSCGLQIACNKNEWFTVRIKVDRPGWYTPTFTAWDRNSTGIYRAYISEVDDTTPLASRGDVYCTDANSIGTFDGYAVESSGVIYHSKVLRSVYFEHSGEYAFTIKSIGRTGSSYNMRPSSLKLERIGLQTAAAQDVLPEMTDVISNTTAKVATGESVTLNIKPKMENENEVDNGAVVADAAYEDLLSAQSVTASATGNVTAEIVDVKNVDNNITGKALKLTGVSAGDATVTLTVKDAYGIVTTDTIAVTVTEPVVKCFGNTYYYIEGTKDGEYKLGLFGGIDSTDYQEVGFEVNGVKTGGQKVYEKINISYTNNGTAKAYEITPAAFALDSGYVFYHEETITTSIADNALTVRAYAIDEDGEYIYGATVTIPDADGSAVEH